MEKIIFSTVITAITIVCICIAWCFSYWAKHKERLLMIEKGLDPKLPQEAKKDYNHLLKVGVLILGLGIGMLVINILGALKLVTSDIVATGIMGISGGISLIIANYLGKAKVNGN